MRWVTGAFAALAVAQPGCTTAVILTYQTLGDVRTVREQHEDARITGTSKDQPTRDEGGRRQAPRASSSEGVFR